MSQTPLYQITIAFDNESLQKIYHAGQSVTIVNAVSSYVASMLASANAAVAWLAFRPLQQNLVAWDPRPQIYATVTQPAPLATILINSITGQPAQTGALYTFAQGFFSGASGQGLTYNAANQMSGYNIYLGLAQQANVNGQQVIAPQNTTPVLQGQQAMFTPQQQISIFLSTLTQSGSIVPSVPQSALTFTLKPQQQQQLLVSFNSANNTFYLASA